MTKISALTALTGAGVDGAADLVPIVDMSETGAARNKKITANELKTALGVGGATPVTTQAGTSYTAVLGDANSYIRFTNGSAINFTIPPNSSVAFTVGTVIEVEQAGAGALSLVAGAGVTINSRGADLTLAGQYAVAAVKKVATDTWTLTGDL